MSEQDSASDEFVSQTVGLDPAVIDEIVDRLSNALVERVLEAITAERLISGEGGTQAWLDAQEVARRLGVSRERVYEHADELGAMTIGTGPGYASRRPASTGRAASQILAQTAMRHAQR